MIVFGSRSVARLLGVVSLVCSRCSLLAAHRIERRTRWFTLFLVPLIPLHVARTMTCTACSARTSIARARVDHLLGGHGSPAHPPQVYAPGGDQPSTRAPWSP